VDQVADPTVEDTAQGFIEFQFRLGIRIELLNFAEESAEDRDFISDLFQSQKAGFVSVIQIGCAVGEFVGGVDELGFERRLFFEQIFRQLRKFGRLVAAGV
jgi:hypothetical protein